MAGITGRLENWEYNGISIIGNIYGDTDERFPDGFSIRTSAVATDEKHFKKGAIVTTRNSTYLLGEPAKEL